MSTENKETIADILAAKRESEATCEKTPWVGNAAAMRKAVKTALEELLLWNYTDRDTARMALGVMNKLDAALSAPLRNCDAFSKDKVLEMLEVRSFSKEDTIEWLYAEANGDEE